jgi:P27 family predicted phage terminase small subunit
MRGRKPKPIKLKLLEGNRGKKPIPKEFTVNLPAGPVTPPAFLDEYARSEWERLAPGLEAIGLLTPEKEKPFAAYCDSYSTWRHAQEELDKLRQVGGEIAAMIYNTKSGNAIQHPLIGIKNKAKADMVRYAVEFGLTPSGMARLAIDVNRAKKSKFDGLIGKDDK